MDVPGLADERRRRRCRVRGFAVEGIETLADGDAVLDFEITANRPDCLSLVGMAREVATAYDLPLRCGPSIAAQFRRVRLRSAPALTASAAVATGAAAGGRRRHRRRRSKTRTSARATRARSPT